MWLMVYFLPLEALEPKGGNAKYSIYDFHLNDKKVEASWRHVFMLIGEHGSCQDDGQYSTGLEDYCGR